MSGTSCDGVDAAVVDVTGRANVNVLAFKTYPYAPSLRRRILDVCRSGAVDVALLCRLDFVLGEVFAEAVIRLAEEANLPLRSIDLVGSHGQTVRHEPRRRRIGRWAVRGTLQLGEPSVIAERTGITTVADFRPRDIAAGGQGAPLTPYVDYLLLADRRRSRAVLNIGGIANVTYLPAACGPGDVVAFDTGPGNMVLDRLAELATGGRMRFDRDGRLAAAGRLDEGLLRRLLRHPYFRRRPPKSTGREQFGWDYAEALRRDAQKRGLGDADILATATALTAESAARACRRLLPGMPQEVILAGGGAKNPTLVRMLAERLAPAAVYDCGRFGIDPDAREAVAFAVLAVETARGRCGNLPAATGASRGVVLGKIVPPRR
ncbi:MAG: anhydro-N-acetylmuramic acid kinase [Planctomycetes bacterium]|nr:anhydro-N-acetylmuramic acid kinase [Planctomycetota bacterium]